MRTVGSASRQSFAHSEVASSEADERVGAHYDDLERAEGLAQLYRAPTALGDFYRQRMRRVASLLGSAHGDLLDAGCGTGQMLDYLQQSAPGRFTLTGLDRSQANITVARRTVGDASSISLVVGRIEEIPFDASTFDVVLTMGSLEYVASVERALAELARVTRPEGVAVVTMQSPSSPYRLWDEKVWSPVRRRLGRRESPILHRLKRRQLVAALTDAGFQLEKVECYGFNMLPPPLDEHLSRLAVAIQRSLDRVLPGPLRGIGSDYVVVARRVAANSRTGKLGAEVK